ncbi:DNA-directed RNA polymerase subunit delta [Sporosarcina sp. FA15]|uniref:DNA-directed RNA polymerase subunit delta n=1 Tax=Sporosarcina sp. FA15 TaxID=3413031 RepID=UPI003F65B4B0
MNIREMTKEQLIEESMIDIAYAVLAERKEPLTLLQLMDAIRKLNGITERVMRTKLQQFYTDMNIDGRFLAINDNRWGLREWYPVDQIEVETAPVVKVRKKKKKKALLEDDDIIEDEDDEDELFDEEFDELIDDDEDDDDDDDDEEEEDVVEIEVDLIDPDDELEIIPDDAELELDEEDEEEEDEDEDEIKE